MAIVSAVDTREQHIGSLMLEQVVHTARERGCVRLWLVNHRKRESYLRSFYGKQGWHEQTEKARLVLSLQ